MELTRRGTKREAHPHTLTIHPWLTYPGSTTAALKQIISTPLQIHVIKQGFEQAAEQETDLLKCRSGESVFIREVILHSEENFTDLFPRNLNNPSPSSKPGAVWMFCRSVFPKKALTGEDQQFTQLNNSSLGSILFKDGTWKRGAFDFWQLHAKEELYEKALPYLLTAPNTLSARCSHFTKNNKIILVTEVFLPDIFRYPAPTFTKQAEKLTDHDVDPVRDEIGCH